MSYGKYNLPVIKSLLLHHSKVSLPPLSLTAIVVPETYLYKNLIFFHLDSKYMSSQEVKVEDYLWGRAIWLPDPSASHPPTHTEPLE